MLVPSRERKAGCPPIFVQLNERFVVRVVVAVAAEPAPGETNAINLQFTFDSGFES